MKHIPCYGLPWMELVDGLGTAAREARQVSTALRLGEPGGPSTLVDLGCGHGRLVPYFDGLLGTYVGIDATEELLAAAPVHDWTAYYLGENAETLSLFPYGSFDAALSWFCSLGCLGPEKDVALFRAVLTKLRPGGSFLIGMLNPFEALEPRTLVNVLKDGGVVLEFAAGLDQATMRYPFQHFHIAPLGGDRYELRRAERLDQTLYTAQTLMTLLHLAGFDSVEVVPGEEEQLILLAKKGASVDSDARPDEPVHVPPAEGGPAAALREPAAPNADPGAAVRQHLPGQPGEVPSADEAGGGDFLG